MKTVTYAADLAAEEVRRYLAGEPPRQPMLMEGGVHR